MKTLISCLIWLLILALSAWAIASHWQVSAFQIKHDPRIAQLGQFESKHHFAPNADIKKYIESADRNHIDYRLLVAISLQESSGCKHYLHNNCWGYGSSFGLVHFTSIPEGIAYISNQLGNSPTYVGKSNFQIAQIYGPHFYNPRTHKYLPSLTYAPTIINYIKEIHVQ